MIYQKIFNQLEILAPEIYEIFQIGRILESKKNKDFYPLNMLFCSDTEVDADSIECSHRTQKSETEQDWHVDVMQRIQDFPRILKKQFMLPDNLFDYKLITRDLLVRQPDVIEKNLAWDAFFEEENKLNKEKRSRRQSTYLLIDISGSTENHHRLLLEKAIAMQFLVRNQREKGRIYLRFFNHEVSKLYVSENGEKSKCFWSHLFNPIAPFGGTSLQKAIITALNDLEYYSIQETTEILVLTDGIAHIEPSLFDIISKNIKINIVIIGDDRPELMKNEMRELIKKKIAKWKLKYESELPSEIFKNPFETMEYKFWKNSDDEQEKYYAHLQSTLMNLAARTGGNFINISDLPPELLSSNELIEALRDELKKSNQRLNEDIPVNEKENILERLISIKNYINSMIRGYYELSDKFRDSLDSISEELKDLINRDPELLEIMKYAKIKVKFSSAQMDKEMTMAKLFRMLFYKLRSYFLRYIR